jgi:diguanylate cyclase (GGDEF)-like protein
MLHQVRKIEIKAVVNLSIDTFLVILCLIMAAASVFYFKRIHRQAHQDELTGLDNRRMFAIRLRQRVDSLKTADENMSLLIVDLDRFKIINDSMGHATGDRLLQEVANRLRLVVGSTGELARMGGDEFAILTTSITEEDLRQLAENVRGELATTFHIDGGVLQIGGSIGISRYPADADSPDELMKTADLAMYCAKNMGRNKIVHFNSDMATRFQSRTRTESELQVAIHDQQFELYFQPQFNLHADKVDAVEALIRWNHPERGLIPPDEFIPVAEECGLLPVLGNWVMDEACRQCACWLNENRLSLRVAVNVSTEQFLQPNFVLEVLKCLKKHNLDPKYLELEVTESVVMADIEVVVASLTLLQKAGIKIALDDFGTGYSSLSYLQDLPLDTLKIDKTFIQKLLQGNQQHESITETIASLARTLGLETVAEGVETEDQLAHVTNLGISVVQGYWYSRPVPAADIGQVVAAINNEDFKAQKAA